MAERDDRGYLGTVLRLTLLAPDIVDAILDVRQPPELGQPRLLEPFPLAWDEQRTALAERAGSGRPLDPLRPNPHLRCKAGRERAS